LAKFQQFWDSLAPNRYIRDIVIRGHTIPFEDKPPPFSGIKTILLKGQFAEVLM
jgi:hypothetical protein